MRKQRKILALALIILLGLIFVPVVPTASFTICHYNDCSPVIQMSSITDAFFCFGAKYQFGALAGFPFQFDAGCMYM